MLLLWFNQVKDTLIYLDNKSRGFKHVLEVNNAGRYRNVSLV